MPSLAKFIINRLKSPRYDVDTILGLPGDYVLDFYEQLFREFRVVNTADEQGAGFAADAYARVKPGKIGVVVATYSVGGLKLANAIAGAYAEKSPVLFISGAPGTNERKNDMKLHHMVGSFSTQKNIFKYITKTSAVLDDTTRAGFLVDQVLEGIQSYSMPGYLELPRDMVNKSIEYDVYTHGNPDVAKSDVESLEEAVCRSLEMIQKSQNPVILAGVEVARFNFGKQLIRFAEKHNIPIATTLLAKSVVDETHPLSLGVYCGGMSKGAVSQFVENSDCLIKLGVFLTDMNLGFQPPKNPKSNEIFCTTDTTRVRLSTYERVLFSDFMHSILGKKFKPKPEPKIIKEEKKKFICKRDEPIRTARFFDKVDSILDKDMAIIADVGDSLFGSADLSVHFSNQFLCPAYYTSMGFAVPGALGVQLAHPKLRPIVIVGDGAFQMTGMEVSTIARCGLNPIIFVLNNQGYLTERFLGYDGEFNDIQSWNYHLIPSVIGSGNGYLVRTEQELHNAIESSLSNSEYSIINVMVDKMDATEALKRMTSYLKTKV